MKKLPILIVVALITFSIGIIAAAIWMTRQSPELIWGIGPSGPCHPLISQKADTFKIGEEGYFPKGAFYGDEHTDQLMRSWYAKTLAQMKESSLLDAPTNHESAVYRFTWLRSFHSKIVVRIWTNGSVRNLSVKESSSENKKQNAQITVDQSRSLTEDEWTAFARLLDEACPWTLPSTQGTALAMDGAWWVFEANSNGYYHVVARQSPERSYRDLGLYIVKLSGLPVDASKGEVY
ncbi:MAG TPA: hypothetical protein VFY34_03500 [Pyrinomonadaceae bacterium]|nr:hypothetical protein [Pyrinomonadaceae bacterium]